MQPSGYTDKIEKVREIIERDLLAEDLHCSFFISALQSYKRDSVLRPFPPKYLSGEHKDFDGLLADVGHLPSLTELLQSRTNRDQRSLSLLSWILSPKNFTLKSVNKNEFEKIQNLTGYSVTNIPRPDFLFEVMYSDQMNAKFEETKGERDTMYAFHGSRIENFHSILHNGLHYHLNKTSLFGEGTYLTSDLSLALLYSPHGNGWEQSTLGPVLSCVAACEIIDHPDVKCQVKRKDSDGIDRKRARAKHSEGGDVPQKYFVVTNNQLLRVRHLLVYSEKQHRRRTASQPSWFFQHRFALIMSLYLILLIIIGASNSPAFQYYWNRLFEA